MPTWAGLDPGASAAFLAGFGICEIGFATVFAGLIGIHMLKRLLSAAGL